MQSNSTSISQNPSEPEVITIEDDDEIEYLGKKRDSIDEETKKELRKVKEDKEKAKEKLPKTILYLLFKENIQLFYLFRYWTSLQEKVKNNEEFNIEEDKKPEVEENINYIINCIEKELKEKTLSLMNQMGEINPNEIEPLLKVIFDSLPYEVTKIRYNLQ